MTALAKYELLEAPGLFFDGSSAAGREVVVKFGDASLILMSLADMPIAHWSLAGLRNLAEGEGPLTLTPDHDSDERLSLDDRDMVAAIREVCPDLGRGRPARPGGWRKLALWGAAAVAALYLIVFHLVPALADRMAALIPPEAEVAMGEEMVESFAGLISRGEPRFCSSPKGDRALAAMTARLTEGLAVHVPLDVRVLDHEMVNAFALPGGQIVLFRGLLEASEGPEMAAGVLAHEIGHVVARDPTRLALRAAGSAGLLGLVLGDFTGATVTVALSEALLRSSYQREAEAAADRFAATLLTERGLPTAPLARFFEILKEKHGEGPFSGALSHLATHPDLDGRAVATRAADEIGGGAFRPVLNDQEWVALKGVCDG